MELWWDDTDTGSQRYLVETLVQLCSPQISRGLIPDRTSASMTSYKSNTLSSGYT